MLVTVSLDADITVVEIAHRTGVSRGTVLRAIRDLQEAGMLKLHRRGRRNTYRINEAVTFRHPMLRHSRIRELLRAFSPTSPAARDDDP